MREHRLCLSSPTACSKCRGTGAVIGRAHDDPTRYPRPDAKPGSRAYAIWLKIDSLQILCDRCKGLGFLARDDYRSLPHSPELIRR